MKKRLISLFICVCMLVTLLSGFSVVIYAESGNTYYVAESGSDDNNGTSELSPFKTINKALITALQTESKIVLLSDIEENIVIATTSDFSQNITLDLNGHVLEGTGTGSVITVCAGATLTIEDSGSTERWFTDEDEDGCYEAYSEEESEGAIKVSGGCITGGREFKEVECGGGIYNQGGTLTINGGNIIGNAALFGGGIYNGYGYVGENTVIDGTTTINGGNIIGNVAVKGNVGYDLEMLMGGHGGGIYNASGCTVTINGAGISENTACQGGGIYNDGGEIVVNSGNITENCAREIIYEEPQGEPQDVNLMQLFSASLTSYCGGGIYNNCGVVNIKNGSVISNNTADCGGGIYNYSGTVDISGNSHVDENTADCGGGIYNQNMNEDDINESVENIIGSVFITGSTVSGNSASLYGGGIENAGELTIDSSNINNNKIAGSTGEWKTGFGGAGIRNIASIEVQRSTRITGNYVVGLNITDNLMLWGDNNVGNVINIGEGGLTGDAYIGVSHRVDPTEAEAVFIVDCEVSKDDKDNSGYFFSDEDYVIEYRADKEQETPVEQYLVLTYNKVQRYVPIYIPIVNPTKPVEAGPCPQDETCVYAKFTDSDPKEWYHPGVHYCVEKKYMDGTSDVEFEPNENLTRAMIVTILWRIEGSPLVDYDMTFEDVPAGMWYTDAIRWAQSTEVVEGYNAKTFGPDDFVTREQLAAILMRYAAYKKIDVSKRADLKAFLDAYLISDWALDNMKWANAVEIIKGRTTTELAPQGFATRAEAANMIQRFCNLILKLN